MAGQFDPIHFVVSIYLTSTIRSVRLSYHLSLIPGMYVGAHSPRPTGHARFSNHKKG